MIQPNKVYLLISSASGPSGSSVGRKCRTVHVVDDRPPHTLWGPIWVIESVDGKPFANSAGGSGMRSMAAEDWLQDIPPEPPLAKPRIAELDLTT